MFDGGRPPESAMASAGMQALEVELAEVSRAAGAPEGPGDDRFMYWRQLVASRKTRASNGRLARLLARAVD